MPESQHITLVANTVATVTFTDGQSYVEVVNVTGTAAIYFTVDGSTPTVKGAGTVVLPAAIGGVELYRGTKSVKLISTGTPDVAVRGW